MKEVKTTDASGNLTAYGIFLNRKAEGLPYNWSAFCVVPDYCTSPCDECWQEGRKALKASENTS